LTVVAVFLFTLLFGLLFPNSNSPAISAPLHHTSQPPNQPAHREMDLADEVSAIVAKAIAKCDKDSRLKPHAASTARHLGDAVLPVFTLVTVDNKFAKRLRSKLSKLAPPPQNDGAPPDERPASPLLDLILALRDAVSHGGTGCTGWENRTHEPTFFFSLFRCCVFSSKEVSELNGVVSLSTSRKCAPRASAVRARERGDSTRSLRSAGCA
jgi:hypothetical protein